MRHVKGEPRGTDGWMGMTNREEQEVRREDEEEEEAPFLPTPEISIRIHHKRRKRNRLHDVRRHHIRFANFAGAAES